MFTNLKNVALVIVFGSLMALSNTASAATVTWDFSNPQGDVVGSGLGLNPATEVGHAYPGSNVPATVITAFGFTTTQAPGSTAVAGNTWAPSGGTFSTGTVGLIDLYGKVTAGDPTETGLGLNVANADKEIQSKSFVQLDLSQLEAQHFTNLSLSISSIQTGEGFYIWGSNTKGTPGTLLASGTAGPAVQSVTGANLLSYTYLSISAKFNSQTNSDVLLMNGLSAQPSGGPSATPLPASAWGGIVLLAALAVVRKFRRPTGPQL